MVLVGDEGKVIKSIIMSIFEGLLVDVGVLGVECAVGNGVKALPESEVVAAVPAAGALRVILALTQSW